MLCLIKSCGACIVCAHLNSFWYYFSFYWIFPSNMCTTGNITTTLHYWLASFIH